MPKNKNIIVTGGAGFIGSHLVEELLKDNKVTVIDDFSIGKEENLAEFKNNPNLKVIKADIRYIDQMYELTKDADIIYHLAVRCLRASIQNPMLVHDINATGTLNLLIAALKNNVKLFVYVSTSEVYGTAKTVPMNENHPLEPTTPYGASKLAGEMYTQSFYLTYNLPTIIIRPFNSYGPKECYEGARGEVIPKFAVRMMNDKRPLIFGDGEQTRDFTYVKDTARGMVQASDCKEMIGQIVNLARGQEVSIKNIAKYVSEALGREDLTPEYHEGRPADVKRHFADISKAKKLFNFDPKIEIKEGIKIFIGWIKKQPIDISKEKDKNWEK